MSQQWSEAADQGAREFDLALAIDGWPAVLTVSGAYDLPQTGPLSVAKGFAPNTAARISRPRVGSGKDRRRPEDGWTARREIEIDLIDPVGAGASLFPKSLPALGRRATLWKGKQSLALSLWAEAFVGVIAGVSRVGPRLVLVISDSTWLLDEGGPRRLHADHIFRNGFLGPFDSAGADNYWDSINPPDLRVTIDDAGPEPPQLNSRYVLSMLGSWFGVEGALDVTHNYQGPGA